MDEGLTYSGKVIRIAILFLAPTTIALVAYYIANSDAVKSANMQNIGMTFITVNLGAFFLFFGIGFALLIFIALLYAFTVKKDIHG